jgi:hypothetical protein
MPAKTLSGLIKTRLYAPSLTSPLLTDVFGITLQLEYSSFSRPVSPRSTNLDGCVQCPSTTQFFPYPILDFLEKLLRFWLLPNYNVSKHAQCNRITILVSVSLPTITDRLPRRSFALLHWFVPLSYTASVSFDWKSYEFRLFWNDSRESPKPVELESSSKPKHHLFFDHPMRANHTSSRMELGFHQRIMHNLCLHSSCHAGSFRCTQTFPLTKPNIILSILSIINILSKHSIISESRIDKFSFGNQKVRLGLFDVSHPEERKLLMWFGSSE